MDCRELCSSAREQAEQLPATDLTFPFGPEVEVYKVRGKIFALIVADPQPDDHIVTLKADPADGLLLRENYPEIRPGYHMNKRHWITLAAGELPASLVQDLVVESYLAVVAKLPLKRRPVDPERFLRPG